MIALSGDEAAGWMQVGPRADIPEFNKPRRVSAPLDIHDETDPTVWAISCFFIRGRMRGKGLTHLLVAAGIDFARSAGARLLEACPIDQSKDTRSVGLFVGPTLVFAEAGVSTRASRKPGRPLMRLAL